MAPIKKARNKCRHWSLNGKCFSLSGKYRRLPDMYDWLIFLQQNAYKIWVFFFQKMLETTLGAEPCIEYVNGCWRKKVEVSLLKALQTLRPPLNGTLAVQITLMRDTPWHRDWAAVFCRYWKQLFCLSPSKYDVFLQTWSGSTNNVQDKHKSD